MPGAGDGLAPPATTPRLGKVSGTSSCPQTWGQWGAFGVSPCPSEQTFQWCFCLCICWWDHPAHVFCPPPRASSGRGYASPMAAVSEEGTLMFLLVVHLETPLRRWRLIVLALWKHRHNFWPFFLFSFLKIFCYTVTRLLLHSNLGHLYPLEYVCRMLFFLICPTVVLKPTLSQFKPARGLKHCFVWTWTLQHWITGSIQPKVFRNFRIETVLEQPVWIHLGGAEPQRLLCTALRHSIWCVGSIRGLHVSRWAAWEPPDTSPSFPQWEAPELGAAYGAKLCLFIYLRNKTCDLEPSCVFMISSHY